MQWAFATFLVYDTAPIAGRGPGDGTGFTGSLVVCMVALPPPIGICRNNAKFTFFESRDPIEVAVLCAVAVPYTRLPVLLGLAYRYNEPYRYTQRDQGHQANTRTPLPVHHGATLTFSATRPYPTTCQQLFPPRSRPPLLPLIFLLSPPWAPRSLQHGRPISFPPASPAVDASRRVRWLAGDSRKLAAWNTVEAT